MQVLCLVFYTHLENSILSVALSTGRIVERDRDVVLDRRDVELDRAVVLVQDVEVEVDPFVDVSAVDVSAVDVSALVDSFDVSALVDSSNNLKLFKDSLSIYSDNKYS